ncbi:MAG TPA: NUDIX domain-containing protein [Kineosporiaceae bacterium]|nr:NUDIX domain-containing protein [Kineosporiaceae bacterium]
MSPTSPTGGPGPDHEVLAVVLQVREGALSVLLWWRALAPDAGRWSLPGGALGGQEGLRASISRQLAEKVDVRQLSHLEQLDSRGEPERVPGRRVVATSYLGLIPGGADPVLPGDTRWYPTGRLPRMAFDHADIIAAGVHRLRSKLSYTNLGFALAPPLFTMSELAGHYRAALGHDVDSTNLQRILVRRDQIEATGDTVRPGRGGGRPAAVFRFRAAQLEVTDAFAVLHPPRVPQPSP